MSNSIRREGYRVLIIAPRPFFVDRGFSIQVLEEAKALRMRGNDLLVCCYSLGDDIDGIKITRHLSIPWYKDPTEKVSLHYIYFDIFLFFHALKSALRFKPDIIHAHIHEGGLIGIIIGKLLKTPVVLDVQGSMLGEYKERGFPSNFFIKKIINFIERKIDRNVDGIITWINYRIDFLIKQSGVDKNKVYMFNLGMDTELFSPRECDIKLLKILNIPSDRKIIGYLGLLTPYQGIEYLLEALKYILKMKRNVHLLLMGFPNLDFYKKKSVELGIADFITITGKIPYHHAPRYLSLCDIAVSPKISLQETNGKLINYMAMGIPIVVFDTPINREILGDLGVYANLKSSADLAKCILYLIDLKDDKIELQIKLRERAKTKYSLESMADDLMNIYKKILQHS